MPCFYLTRKDWSVILIMLTEDDRRWSHSLYLAVTKGQCVFALYLGGKDKDGKA